MQGNEGFSNGEPSNRFLEGKVSKASTSATNLVSQLVIINVCLLKLTLINISNMRLFYLIFMQEFDMDLVEALFGTIED